jgi:hypothetical protein
MMDIIAHEGWDPDTACIEFKVLVPVPRDAGKLYCLSQSGAQPVSYVVKRDMQVKEETVEKKGFSAVVPNERGDESDGSSREMQICSLHMDQTESGTVEPFEVKQPRL